MPSDHRGLNPQKEYAAQLDNTIEWLTGNVEYVEKRINEYKTIEEPTLSSVNESLNFANQNLNAFQSQRFGLLTLRDEKIDTQDMKDKATTAIQDCKRAESVLKQWIAWLEFQQHRLSRSREADDEDIQE
jgi:hypothetical protein